MGRIYLVREADAGSRLSWPGPDRLRPLTSRGWHQAQELALCLDKSAIDRIVASPWLRCQQPVLPLAERRSLSIESEAALGQIASVDRAMTLIGGTRQATVYYGHPELLYAIVERLRLAGERVRPLCALAWAVLTPSAAAAAVP
ncbi:MAG TPA: histidine phosphatase family protein [Candidatus Dormibacteraeota bacterium]|nr:histidine phosphatase family protein [Candidatus Dormibacteraeota bacterium]